MTPKLFSELGLSPELLKAIDKLGFEQASPIQAEAIPVLLSGKDIVGQSQTGSGKTAAFAVPAIERTDPHVKAVQVLVLCPTRELAVQVSEEVHKLAFFKRGIISLPIYGGQSYERQFYGLKQGAQIVIGTPGRVMDHLDRGSLRLDQLKMIILDEADVMLDMGFREDIEKILLGVPAERQTVFFSATMPRPIKLLIEKFAREPVNVQIEQKSLTVPTVEQVYYEVDRRFKVELLTRLIDIHDLKLGIIFCNTKRMVDELVEQLEAQGYLADRLHGDMNQAQRDRVMNRFRKSGLEFLVATDVAARGIDVDDVQVVFNYDLPYDVEDYVHRIGRTGRAGRSGRAISFVSGRELFQIRNIERYTNTRVHRGRVPTLEEVDEARSNFVVNKVRETLQAGKYPRRDHMVERLLEEGFTSTDIASALLHLLQEGDEAPASGKVPADRPGIGSPSGERAAPRERGFERERPAPREPRGYDRDRGGYERGPERRGGFDRDYPRDVRSPRPDDRFDRGPRDDRRAERPEFRKPIERPLRPVKPPAPPAAKPVKSHAPAGTPASTQDTSSGSPASPPTPTPVPTPVRPSKPTVPSSPEVTAPAPTPAQGPAPTPAKKPKHAKPEGLTRLHMNAGVTAGLADTDVVNAIMGETGLPAKVVGKVDLREKHLFVEVSAEHANAIVAKLNRSGIGGRKVKVKLA
ncbi:MAG TPA: DEAD/DEAH box helicase [Verrucomicrobiales bacterium]|nr:DEAD/DEAH box helicase [Verrucomicrobiales bacterium]